MIRNIFIAVLLIVLFILFYQNNQLSTYSQILEEENAQLQTKLNQTLIKQKGELDLKYLSPLYKQTRFYSTLPYEYQWYLQDEYNHIQAYQEPEERNELVDFYNNLNILPDVEYDKESDDLTIKLQIKKVF